MIGLVDGLGDVGGTSGEEPTARISASTPSCSTYSGVTVVSPEELKTMLDDAGFIQTEIHRMKPSNATIIGMKA